jgi:hypothetical protein
MVIHSQGGWGSFVVEVPSFKDRLDITFTSPGPAVRLPAPDPRMAKFLIKNLEVGTPLKAGEKDQSQVP